MTLAPRPPSGARQLPSADTDADADADACADADVGLAPYAEIEPEVAMVLGAVPEFTPRYLALVGDFDEHPGVVATFMELADFVADLTLDVRRSATVLAKVLMAVEMVARTSIDAEEVIGWSFLDPLGPEAMAVLGPWLGPATRAVAAHLDFDFCPPWSAGDLDPAEGEDRVGGDGDGESRNGDS